MAPIKSSKNKRVRPKLTEAQKEARKEKFADLGNAINEARNFYHDAARNIANKHGRSFRWTRKQLFLSRNRRSANPWNAFLRRKLNEVNANRDAGVRYRLQDFMAKRGTSLRHQYRMLSMDEKRSLAKEIESTREERRKTYRANPKAVQRDVDSAFSSMEQEWTAIMSRTGVEGLYIAVRGSVEDYNEPKLFFSEKAFRFVKEVLDIEPQHLALKFEAWCVSGLDKAPTTTRATPRAKIISRCRTLIQTKLDDVLRENRIEKKSVDMNYRNYEGKIVEKYGVALAGWPTTIPEVCNPSTVGARLLLEKLLDALESGQCHWIVLTEDQVDARKKANQAREARGEAVYKPRKSAARAATTASKKSCEIIDDEVEDEITANDNCNGGNWV